MTVLIRKFPLPFIQRRLLIQTIQLYNEKLVLQPKRNPNQQCFFSSQQQQSQKKERKNRPVVSVITHPSFQHHRVGDDDYHPESPKRIIELQKQLPIRFQKQLECGDLHWYDSNEYAPEVHVEQLLDAGHTKEYIDEIMTIFDRAEKERIKVTIDRDTSVSSSTKEAALRSAGATTRAVDLIMNPATTDDDKNTNDKESKTNSKGRKHVFCLIRPPGHHATKDRSMGFCFFNNVAVGIAHARKKYNIQRIAVIDFDVHHGNGTQDILWNDTDTFFISLHESPLYPYTGNENETGGTKRHVLNIPLQPGTTSTEYKNWIESKVIPDLKEFQPEILFFSSGFDAHASDPLAHINLEAKDYYDITKQIISIIPNTISCLEGGYNVEALVNSSSEHLRALLDPDDDDYDNI